MKKQEKKDRKKERQMVNIAYLCDVEQPIGRNLVKKKMIWTSADHKERSTMKLW